MNTESKKQLLVSQVLYEDLSSVLSSLQLSYIDGKMVSMSRVYTTPDLLEARIYLSIYPYEHAQDIVEKIKKNEWEIKKKLVEKLRHKLRRMPRLQFYIDDSLDHMYQMENLFQQIKKP